MTKRICVIGGGRWGLNHIKTLHGMGNLSGIVENNVTRLKELVSAYPEVKGYETVDEALNDSFDGFIVATPAETHYHIGKKLLELGKNVLIEKPMTLSSEHSEELVKIAEKTGARLMVGHILLFHPAIRKMKELIENNTIGKLYYIYSNRLNLGTVRTEENVFWSFAPHDISVLNFLIGKSAVAIEAKASTFLQPGIADFVMAQMSYPDNINGHIFTSWLHPFKEQKLVVIGSKGMLTFNDASAEKELVFHDKHIAFDNGIPVKKNSSEEIIPYESKMPLTEELTYFVNHLDSSIEIANGKSGHEVVKVLETVQQIIDNKNR
jgi:predicted dehydrogenase